MRGRGWLLAGALALLGCGSITPLAPMPGDGAAPATVSPDSGAGSTTPPGTTAAPDTSAMPEAGPGSMPGTGGDKGDDGMGGKGGAAMDGKGDAAPGGAKAPAGPTKGPTDASRPQK